jgi:hypothetical protein
MARPMGQPGGDNGDVGAAPQRSRLAEAGLTLEDPAQALAAGLIAHRFQHQVAAPAWREVLAVLLPQRFQGRVPVLLVDLPSQVAVPMVQSRLFDFAHKKSIKESGDISDLPMRHPPGFRRSPVHKESGENAGSYDDADRSASNCRTTEVKAAAGNQDGEEGKQYQRIHGPIMSLRIGSSNGVFASQ